MQGLFAAINQEDFVTLFELLGREYARVCVCLSEQTKSVVE